MQYAVTELGATYSYAYAVFSLAVVVSSVSTAYCLLHTNFPLLARSSYRVCERSSPVV